MERANESGLGAEIISLLDARIELRINQLMGRSAQTPRTIRIAAGFRTATALAEASGVAKGYISRIENGLVRSLGIRSGAGGPLDRLARALGCSPEEYQLAVEVAYQSRRTVRPKLPQKEIDAFGPVVSAKELGRGKITLARGAGQVRGVRSTA
ncbi:MAG: helix-turn-helix transcriptional regulator [Planctomycetes bacterium]|nr:helix-turn-helix transcriptional regulator [Planctomycetota bacterium]